MKKAHFYIFIFLLITFASTLVVSKISYAQKETQAKKFQFKGVPVSSNQLRSRQGILQLWGVKAITGTDFKFEIESREALDTILDGNPAICQKMGNTQQYVLAQCTNHTGKDLAQEMLNQGYLLANRSEIVGTLFESPYNFAELNGKQAKLGVWSPSFMGDPIKEYMLITNIVGFSSLALFILYLSFSLNKSLSKLLVMQSDILKNSLQNKSNEKKEKFVLAAMLQAEVDSNRNKIEAHMSVYTNLQSTLLNKEIQPHYMEAGDVIQKEPVLDRIIFDTNLSKMETLGPSISRTIIHLYARVKNKPNYIDIAANLPREKVLHIINAIIENDQKLLNLCNKTLTSFNAAGYQLIEPTDREEEEELADNEIALPDNLRN